MPSVRPDQYYTDVIARPMSVLGRRAGQGAGAGQGGQAREVEVILTLKHNSTLVL